MSEQSGRTTAVRFMGKDPQAMRVWAKGSAGERKLLKSLSYRVGERAVLLHHRQIPRSPFTIDHLVVAASGVWIVDAKPYLGDINWRNQGSPKVDYHLYVGGRDRSILVARMTPQVDAVYMALSGRDVPVHAVLCFSDAEWGIFTRPFQIGGVWATPPRRLAWMVAKPGPLSDDEVLEVAERLHTVLRPM